MIDPNIRFGRVVLFVLELADNHINHPWIGLIGHTSNPDHAYKQCQWKEDWNSPPDSIGQKHRDAEAKQQKPGDANQSAVAAEPRNFAQ